MSLVKVTIKGCWSCGQPWNGLRCKPLASDPIDTAYYCEQCDVFTRKTHAPGLITVAERYPTLTRYGFYPYRDKDQARLTETDADIFTRVCGWLRGMSALKHPNRRVTSYGLKHLVEAALGDYVANGVFIAAAVHCGFALERIPGSPNVYFNIAQRDLVRRTLPCP